MSCQGVKGRRQARKDVHQERGQRSFTNPSQGQGGQRDTELSAGDAIVEVCKGAEGYIRFVITTLSESFEASRTGSDEGELSRHKEGVQSYQSQDSTNFKENVHGLPGCS